MFGLLSAATSKINAIKDINIYLKKGDSIGIIGTSGAGKTTLLDILLGLLIPQEGTINLDE